MDTKRNINVKIGARDYNLTVRNDDEEELYRKTADTVNKFILQYQKKFIGKSEADILSFVAFNVCMNNIRYAGEMRKAKEEADSLHEQIEAYLKDIDCR